jgi:hypothetical protein
MRAASMRIILSIAASSDLEIHQMDVETAYLNGVIDEEIYIQQPLGFVKKGGEHLACRLNKAIYGLRQSGRAWWSTLSDYLIEKGFKRLTSDSCIFRRDDDDDQFTPTIIGVYVDDLILVAKTVKTINKIKDQLNERFRMKDLNDIKYALGINITRNRLQKRVILTQKTQVEKMLKTFGMENSKPASTPAALGQQLLHDKDGGTCDFPFREAVGALTYLAGCTRPDISAAVSSVARFCEHPTSAHVIAVKRIFRYLRGSAGLGITLGGQGPLTLECYADADWGNDAHDRRSTTGFVCLLGGAISWKTRKQPTVALSTAEAEYMALSLATQEVAWLRTFLTEIGQQPFAATMIHQDNQSSIALAKNSSSTSRAKHIDIRHHFIRERIESGDISVKYCPTEDMVADVLTKGLGPIPFARHCASLSSGSVGFATARDSTTSVTH